MGKPKYNFQAILSLIEQRDKQLPGFVIVDYPPCLGKAETNPALPGLVNKLNSLTAIKGGPMRQSNDSELVIQALKQVEASDAIPSAEYLTDGRDGGAAHPIVWASIRLLSSFLLNDEGWLNEEAVKELNAAGFATNAAVHVKGRVDGRVVTSKGVILI